MNNADKKAAWGARVLQIYCEVMKKHGCDGCIFKPCYKYFSSVPVDWSIPTPPRWTKGDKALAQALKSTGVVGARRNKDIIELLKNVPNSRRQWVVGVYDVSVDMFSAMKNGEYISMTDIINSKGERADDE